MYKLTHLHRLSFKNALLIVLFYFKKIVRVKPSQHELEMHELYHHLIHTNSKLIEENERFFIIEMLSLGYKVQIRKKPSSDLKVFGQVFRGDEYKEVIKVYTAHFGNVPKIIIDAGANVGYTSLLFQSMFKSAKLIVIEPSTENFKMIEGNFKINDINATFFKGGLWSKSTYLNIVRDFRDKSDWAIRVEPSLVQTDLEAFSVQDIMEKEKIKHIDIFKIDIEGSEKEIFKADANIDFLNFVKCLAIEIHDEFECRDQINEILISKGFILSTIGELTIALNKNYVLTNKE